MQTKSSQRRDATVKDFWVQFARNTSRWQGAIVALGTALVIGGLPWVPSARTFKISDSSLQSFAGIKLSSGAMESLARLKGIKIVGQDEFSSIIAAALATEPVTDLQRRAILSASVDPVQQWLAYTLSAIFAFFGLGILVQKWLAQRPQDPAANDDDAAVMGRLGDLRNEDLRSIEDAKQVLEARLKADFLRNLNSTFVLEELKLERVAFFGSASWTFQSGVNILLGRNGYGKSLLLGTLAALLTRDEEQSKRLVGPGTLMELKLIRDAEQATISRNARGFEPSVGKVPLLAIPDTRFINRAEGAFGPSVDSYGDLKEFGAWHFLNQAPYSDLIGALLYEISLDYLGDGGAEGKSSRRKSFQAPVFEFFRRVFALIADEKFEFHSIERDGRTRFKIKVVTEGSSTPIGIEQASQGTLAVIAIFGLIRAFLKALHPNVDERVVCEQCAIVIIDEIDAHLHPAWQQRMTGALREVFPHVQFIVSAHSPLIVAGSMEREVAVLRKKQGEFRIEQVDVEYVGASAAQLYEDLFDIDEPDDSLRKHPVWQPIDRRELTQLQELDRKDHVGTLSADEQLQRASIRREVRVRELAEQALDKRKDDDFTLLKLESEIERLKDQVRRLGGDVEEDTT